MSDRSTADDRAGPAADRLSADDRAVSVSVGYVLNLAVASLLLAGLFVAGGSFVDAERQAAVEDELTVVGERVAADLMTVDRLASDVSANETATVERDADLPPRVAGMQYRLTIEAEATSGTVVLESPRTGATVTVQFRTSADVTVENTTVRGGDLRIAYEWADDPEDGVPKRVVVTS